MIARAQADIPGSAVPPSDIFDVFANNELFAQCGTKALDTLTAAASMRDARRGAVIASEDEPLGSVGIVIGGVIAVTVEIDPRRGRRLHLYEARGGETFGEIAALSAMPPIGDIVVASRRAVYALLPDSVLTGMFAQDAQFYSRFLKRVVERTRTLAYRLRLQQRERVTARVARVLLQFAADRGGMQPANGDLQQLTQSDIAAMAGCVKEPAARAIAQFERLGALRREHGHIAYLDRDALQAVCKASLVAAK